MEKSTDLIRRKIKEKYKTIDNFAKEIAIPRTTVNFILRNGIGSSNFSTIVRFLNALDLSVADDRIVDISPRALGLLKSFSDLDELGKHTIETVTVAELLRVSAAAEPNADIAAYGSLSCNDADADEKSVLSLIHKIKENNKNNA